MQIVGFLMQRLRLTLKNSLFAITRPTHQNCPYPKNFIDIHKELFFLFECLKFQSLNYFFFFFNIYLSECNIVQTYSMKSSCLYDSEHKLKPFLCKIHSKNIIFQFCQQKKKKTKKKKKKKKKTYQPTHQS